MKTADIIKSLLQKTGLTQEELARVLGVSRQALTGWLNGIAEPHASNRQAIDTYYLEVVGRDELADDVLDEAITEAMHCSLTTGKLLASTPVLNAMIVQLTYHTNSIEGSTMTVADNEAVLLHDKVLTNRSAREQLEARNHRAALLWLLDQLENGNFTWNAKLAQSLHTRLMNGLVLDAGEYRNHGVRILGSRVTVANYVKIPILMDGLFEQQEPETIEQMAILHAEFEKIHPFSDGNGRVGRLLLVALALRSGLVLPIIERERRTAYYHALELAQMHGKNEPLAYLLAQEMIAANKNLGLS